MTQIMSRRIPSHLDIAEMANQARLWSSWYLTIKQIKNRVFNPFDESY